MRPLVQVVEELVPVVEMAGIDVDILPLSGRRRVLREGLRLRRVRPDLGVLLTPSFSAALIFWIAGVRERRGTATDGRRWLLSDAVDRRPLLRGHRVNEFLALVERGNAAPRPSDDPPPPRLRRLGRAREEWRALAEEAGVPEAADDGDAPAVGLVPGGNAPSRRWPAGRYAALAARLAGRGHPVLVFGGPGEEALTAEVAGDGGRVRDLGGRTTLWSLAGGLERCAAVVGNDTGPLHLAAAVGRSVVALEGPADVRQTRPLAERLRLVGRFDLPCVPCVENRCPRRGRGYVLASARRECMRSITVEEVEAAVSSLVEEVETDAG